MATTVRGVPSRPCHVVVWLLIQCWFFSIIYCHPSYARSGNRSSSMGRSILSAVPRGGGPRFGFFRKKKWSSEVYRQTLQEQVVLLDRQLRMAKEESSQLRRLLQQSRKTKRMTTIQDEKQQKSLQDSLQTEIDELLKQITMWQEVRDELQNLLQAEQAKVADLEQRLEKDTIAFQEMQRHYDVELVALEKRWLERTQAQIDEFQRRADQRVKDAVEEAQKLAKLELTKQLSEATQRVQSNAERELQEERQKSAEAVEKERVKMRKLVKALAERETKLVSSHDTPENKQNDNNIKRNMLSKERNTKTTISNPVKTTKVQPSAPSPKLK